MIPQAPQEELQKELQIQNLKLCIVDVIRNFGGAKDVCSRLKIKYSALSYHLKSLKDLGIIEKKGYGTWQLTSSFEKKTNKEILDFLDEKKRTSKKSSLGTRNPKQAHLHALNINIPIVSGNVNLEGGYETKLKNWVQYTKKLPNMGVTLRNNNNKSLSVYIWSREIFDTLAIPSLCHAYVHGVCSLFKQEGVTLDYFGWRVTTFHLMIRNEDFDKVLNKGMKVEVLLGRGTEKISENDVTQEAKAWVDSSPYAGIETNDLAYYKNYINMPENIAKTSMLMERFMNEFLPIHREHAINIKTHTAVLKDISKGFAKFNKLLSERQKKLGDWIG